MRDALIVRVDASAANDPVEVRSARREIFRVRRIAALGIEPPFFVRSTALYVHEKCCQPKYQNVLASAAIAFSPHLHTLKYAKLGSRRLVSEKLA